MMHLQSFAFLAFVGESGSGVENRRSDGSLPVAMAELSPRRLSPV